MFAKIVYNYIFRFFFIEKIFSLYSYQFILEIHFTFSGFVQYVHLDLPLSKLYDLDISIETLVFL